MIMPQFASWREIHTIQAVQHPNWGFEVIDHSDIRVAFTHDALHDYDNQYVVVQYWPQLAHAVTVVRITVEAYENGQTVEQMLHLGEFAYRRPERYDVEGGAYHADGALRKSFPRMRGNFLPQRYQRDLDWLVIELLRGAIRSTRPAWQRFDIYRPPWEREPRPAPPPPVSGRDPATVYLSPDEEEIPFARVEGTERTE